MFIRIDTEITRFNYNPSVSQSNGIIVAEYIIKNVVYISPREQEMLN